MNFLAPAGGATGALVSGYMFLAMLSFQDAAAGARNKVRRHSIRAGKAGGGGPGGSDDGVCELEISCKSDDLNPLIPVRLPIRGPRGPPGPKGDKGFPGDGGSAALYKSSGN